MTQPKNDIFEQYQMRVRETRRRAPVYHYMPIDYTASLESVMSLKYETERLLDIEITESNFSRLENDLRHFFLYRHDPPEYQSMVDREIWLRRNNPAVNKAWKNYQMLLKLAAEGRTLDVD